MAESMFGGQITPPLPLSLSVRFLLEEASEQAAEPAAGACADTPDVATNMIATTAQLRAILLTPKQRPEYSAVPSSAAPYGRGPLTRGPRRLPLHPRCRRPAAFHRRSRRVP